MRYGVFAARFAALSSLLLAALLLSGCPDAKPSYPACAGDDDCKDGEHCVDKQCLQCRDDSHCEAFERCQSGGCVLREGACRGDDDCPSGLCRQNRCVACERDAECGPDRRCSNGACLTRGACKVHEDCEDDEDCIDGVCKRAGREEPPDLACTLEPIYFAFDEEGISDSAKSTLEADAECIQQGAGRSVLVIGHTDPRGTEEYNIALSERRARSVADFLARLGIDPAKLRVLPKGETTAIGTDEFSWSRDRRVEFEWL